MFLVVVSWACLAASTASAAESLPTVTAQYVPPRVADKHAMGELLYFFALPHEPGAGVFPVPPLALSVRSRAFVFVPSRTGVAEDPFELLALSAMDLPVTEVPGGEHLHVFLRRDAEEAPLTFGQMGPRLRSEDSPLRRSVREAIGQSLGAKLVGGVMVTAAAAAIVGRLGSHRAHKLGIAPTLSHTVAGGQWHFAVTLHTAPRFENPALENFVRFRLPAFAQELGPRENFVEVGVTGAKLPDGQTILATKWTKLRTRGQGIEVAAGLRSHAWDPLEWLDTELFLQRDKVSLRSTMSQQLGSPHTHLISTAAVELPDVMLGMFAGVQRPTTWTAGVVTMGTF